MKRNKRIFKIIFAGKYKLLLAIDKKLFDKFLSKSNSMFDRVYTKKEIDKYGDRIFS